MLVLYRFMLSGDPVLQDLLGSGHEPDPSLFKAIEPLEVHIGSIDGNDPVRQEVEIKHLLAFGDPDVMVFGVGHYHKGRECAAVVIEVMQFDSSFALAKCGPEKSAETEIDDGSIHRKKRALESKPVMRSDRTAFGQATCRTSLHRSHRGDFSSHLTACSA